MKSKYTVRARVRISDAAGLRVTFAVKASGEDYNTVVLEAFKQLADAAAKK